MDYVGSNSVSAQGLCVVGNRRNVLDYVNVYFICFYNKHLHRGRSIFGADFVMMTELRACRIAAHSHPLLHF